MKIGIMFFIFTLLFVSCMSTPYSQDRIMRKSKRMLADSGGYFLARYYPEDSGKYHYSRYYLTRWFECDKRISLDTLTRICAANIGEYDSVRSAIFIGMSEIMDTKILKFMGDKLAFGNPLEKLTASTYIYNYYGIKMTFGDGVPLASSILLFYTIADSLSKSVSSPFYADIDKKREIAKTFPQTQGLYREFILNENSSFDTRVWFVESLMEHTDREMVSTFLLGIDADLGEEDQLRQVVGNTVYAVMSRGTQGGWLAVD